MPSEKLSCASLLKHGLDVQQRHYDLSQAAASDARMANIVDKMVAGEVVSDEHLKPQIKRNNYLYFHRKSFVSSNNLPLP